MSFLQKIFGNKKVAIETITTEKVTCVRCGAIILPETAKKHEGKCVPCSQGKDIVQERKRRDGAKQASEEAKQSAVRYWEEQLNPLPQKALLAFATRCLQRTYSFVNRTKDMPKAIINDSNMLIKVIKIAEEKIGNKVSSEDFRALKEPERYQLLSTIGVHIGLAAARVGVRAEECCSHDKFVTARSVAEIMVTIETIWGFLFGGNIPDFFITPLKQDLDILLRRAQVEGWTDNAEFPAEFFGPLWPEERPEGW